LYDILARITRNGVTALLNFSEDSALEAIHILTNILGLSIPENISVITMEDLPVFQYLTPPHTVIRQPLAELVRVGVGEMIRLCNGEGRSSAEVIDITLPSELIERDSVRQIDSRAE
jgi:LacI family transcriptional regulator